jgi:GAF domain-containing protein
MSSQPKTGPQPAKDNQPLAVILRELRKQVTQAMPLPLATRQDFTSAIHQARELQSAYEQLSGLLDTFAAVNSSLELAQTLESVMDIVIKLTGAERAYVMLHDPDLDAFSIQAARNFEQESLTEQEITFSRTVIAEAFEQRQPVVTSNAQQDERYGRQLSISKLGLRSILCLPLLYEGDALGVVYADNRLNANNFNRRILPVMGVLAQQLAVAIANAQHFEQVRADLERAQREVHRLRIQVDQERVQQEAAQITETDYFRNLEALADELRGEFQQGDDER